MFFFALTLLLLIQPQYGLTNNTNTSLNNKINILIERLNVLERRAGSQNPYCALRSNKPCGPCACQDDDRLLENIYCDCGQLPVARDCKEHWSRGARIDGIYKVNQLGLGTIRVFCDQTSNGGGWTVIQRRVDGTENFYRDWESYKLGFGSLQHEHWLGNKHIHSVELQAKFGLGTELRIDLEKFDGTRGYATYDMFQLGNESIKFKLHISGYQGNVTYDALAYHNGAKFTTYDRDNDDYGANAAQVFLGGWWFKNTHQCQLNGKYSHLGQAVKNHAGLYWYKFETHSKSLKKSVMKIRRKT